jgi:aarF domain-containing kinase
MDMDFRLMTTAARIIDVIPALSWLHVRDSVEQFSHTMAQQAYLQVEAHHLEVLNNNFRGWAHVSFPRPLYASSAVIIETFEPGKIVTEVLDTYDSVAAKLNQNGTIGNLISNMIVVEKDDETDKAKETTPERQTLIEGYELIPPQMAKFVVTSGLGMYLKMLLVDNLMHVSCTPLTTTLIE